MLGSAKMHLNFRELVYSKQDVDTGELNHSLPGYHLIPQQ